MARLLQHGFAARGVTTLVILLFVSWGSLACSGDDGSKGKEGEGEPVDSGTPDDGATDSGPEDQGCIWHPVPNCPDGQHAVQDPPEPGCEDGPWHCEPCPDPRTFPACPLGQSHQMEDGCLSPTLCDCTIKQPPQCQQEGHVPQRACEPTGKCCWTGACGPDCPYVDPPDCSIFEEEERDERGCLTGKCTPLPCYPTEVPNCQCLQRPARDGGGCITGACEEEPVACTLQTTPECPDGKVPLISPNDRCLRDECVSGACVNRCDHDWECASSDVCQEYLPGCRACFPKACWDFRDCPNYTDCIENRCVLRATATCVEDEDCGDPGLICDAARCGACEPPCECVVNDDCEEGMRCADCACVPGCRTDGDCTLPERCHVASGECRGCACDEHEDCPGGEFCNGCFCAPGCRVNDDCPPWQVCGPENQCIPEVLCRRRADCGPGKRCVDTRCIAEPGACQGGGEPCEPFFDACSCDYVCAKQHERPPSCSRDCGDLDPAPPLCMCTERGCVRGECEGPGGPPCPAPYHCSKLLPGNVLSPGICREGRPPARQLCRIDADCVPEDCCKPTLCVNAASAACHTPVDCENDQECRPPILGCTCDEGVCQTQYRFEECREQ